MTSHTALGMNHMVESLSFDTLLLDAHNPRFANSMQEASQTEILRELARACNIQHLTESMCLHGYMGDPLLGIRQEAKDGTSPVLIVDGNRRLAAIQLLLSPEIQDSVGWQVAIQPGPAQADKMKKIPVQVFEDRSDIDLLLGVRHVRGVEVWTQTAKARYVQARLHEGHKEGHLAKTLGVHIYTLRRWLQTLYVLEQAFASVNTAHTRNQLDSEHTIKFAWAYTALSYESIRKYLSLSHPAQHAPQECPVPAGSMKNLHLFMEDLGMYGYGTRPRNQAVTDSRQIRILAAVYDNPEALDVLRGGGSLERAHARSVGEVAELELAMRTASEALDHAERIAHRHKHNGKLRNMALDIRVDAENLVDSLRP